MANTLRRSALQLIRKKNIVATSMVRLSSSNAEKNILTSVYKDVPANNLTVPEFIWKDLDRWADKTAMVCAVTGRSYTYAAVHAASQRLGASLRLRLRLSDNDCVAVLLPNCPEYPVALLGVLEAGCVASMMNPLYTPDELQRQFETVECKVIIASKISYPNIKTALNSMKKDIPIILIDNEGLPDGTIKFSELSDDVAIDVSCLKQVKRSQNDVAVLPFSSGTSGFPKGVVLSHRSVVAANFMIADPEIVAIEETTATHQSVLPAVLPFFHIFGFNALLLNQLSLGCKLVTLPYFKPELFLKTIVGHKADVLFIVPPMVVFLGRHPAVTTEHLSSIKGIISGGAPLSGSDAQAVIDKNKNIIFRQGYGLTETNGGTSVARKVDHNHAAVGHLFGSCRVKIAQIDTHEALGPGEEGEIWFKGPNLMEGYYKNDDATREVMTSDGWFKTGDVGKYDDKKYLYVTDRLKELIKVKGFQVPPAELETILRTHPKVLDCAVAGIPDPVAGELPKAFVVLQAGQTVVQEEILDYVNSKVAAYKKIKEVQIVPEIPKNASGKILRKDLKAKYC